MAREDVAAALQAEARSTEFFRTLAGRIARALAERVDVTALVFGTDVRARDVSPQVNDLADLVLLAIGTEFEDDVLEQMTAVAAAAGMPKPTAADVSSGMDAAVARVRPALVAALSVLADKFHRNAGRSAGDDPGPEIGADAERAVREALAVVLASHARAFAGAATSEVGQALAVRNADAKAADPGDSSDFSAFTAFLAALGISAGVARRVDESTPVGRWVTRHDGKECSEEAPARKAPSGIPLPVNFVSSCKARHGYVLPLSDWRVLGLPKDERLLCSRFGEERCRCVMVPASLDIPDEPVNTLDARNEGRAAGEEEPIDVDVILEAVGAGGVVSRRRIRIRKRVAAPASPVAVPELVPV